MEQSRTTLWLSAQLLPPTEVGSHCMDGCFQFQSDWGVDCVHIPNWFFWEHSILRCHYIALVVAIWSQPNVWYSQDFVYSAAMYATLLSNRIPTRANNSVVVRSGVEMSWHYSSNSTPVLKNNFSVPVVYCLSSCCITHLCIYKEWSSWHLRSW